MVCWIYINFLQLMFLHICLLVISVASSSQAAWQKVVQDGSTSGLDPEVLPSRLVTDDDLKPFCHAMKLYEPSNVKSVKVNVRKKGEIGGLDTQHYGRGKRAREVSCTLSLVVSLTCGWINFIY